MKARAVVAEDEPLLAESLCRELAGLWPELEIVSVVGDGDSAVEQALARRPEVLFLDIRMPGRSGLDAAQALAEEWPDDATPFPLIVFVTAYDRHAVAAFERAAFDYVLKPVEPQRLGRTCDRLRAALAERKAAARRDDGPAPRVPGAPAGDASLHDAVAQLRSLLGAAPSLARSPTEEPPLEVIQAGVGSAIHLVPVGEVVYFEAADKYVRVVTEGREYLVRASLRDLLPRLDAARFWQVHRGTVVRADAIAMALRDEAGKVTLALRQRPETLVVSRLYVHRFKAM